jgi:hypothetical protein
MNTWWETIQQRDSFKMTVLPTEQHIELYRSIMKGMS